MKMIGRSVGTFAHQASAAVIATVLVCRVASAQEVDFATLPPNVQEAFMAIEVYLKQQNLGEEIAIADFTTIDRSSGIPEPGRAIVVDFRRVTEAEPTGPKKVDMHVNALEGFAEMTFIIRGSHCHLEQNGGKAYWVPSPPCPQSN